MLNSNSLSLLNEVANKQLTSFQIKASTNDKNRISSWRVIYLVILNTFSGQFYIYNVNQTINYDFTVDSLKVTNNLPFIVKNISRSQIYSSLRGITSRTQSNSSAIALKFNHTFINTSVVQTTITSNFASGDLTYLGFDIIIFDKTSMSDIFTQVSITNQALSNSNFNSLTGTAYSWTNYLTNSNSFLFFNDIIIQSSLDYNIYIDSTDFSSKYEVYSCKKISIYTLIIRSYDCPNNTYWYSVDDSCYTECPTGTFHIGDICDTCSSECISCQNTSTTCTSCPMGKYLLNSKCVSSIPNHYYSDNGILKSCLSQCLTCSNNSTCTGCDSTQNKILNINTRLCKAKDGYYQQSGAVLACSQNCLLCNSSTTCSLCNSGYIFNTSNNTCIFSKNQSVCGDRIVSSNQQCDDGNLVNSDGCSDKCKKQAQYFYCESQQYGQTTSSYSKCSLNVQASITASSFAKIPSQNQINVQFTLYPPLPFWQKVDFKNAINLNIKNQRRRLLTQTSQITIQGIDLLSYSSLSVKLQYSNVNLQGKTLQVSVNKDQFLQIPQLVKANNEDLSTQVSAASVPIASTNGLRIDYYSPQMYQFRKFLFNWMLVASSILVFITIISFLLNKGKLATLSAINYFQLVYVGVFFFGDISNSISGLLSLKITNLMFSNWESQLTVNNNSQLMNFQKYGVSAIYFTDIPVYYGILFGCVAIFVLLRIFYNPEKIQKQEKQLSKVVNQPTNVNLKYKIDQQYQHNTQQLSLLEKIKRKVGGEIIFGLFLLGFIPAFFEIGTSFFDIDKTSYNFIFTTFMIIFFGAQAIFYYKKSQINILDFGQFSKFLKQDRKQYYLFKVLQKTAISGFGFLFLTVSTLYIDFLALILTQILFLIFLIVRNPYRISYKIQNCCTIQQIIDKQNSQILVNSQNQAIEQEKGFLLFKHQTYQILIKIFQIISLILMLFTEVSQNSNQNELKTTLSASDILILIVCLLLTINLIYCASYILIETLHAYKYAADPEIQNQEKHDAINITDADLLPKNNIDQTFCEVPQLPRLDLSPFKTGKVDDKNSTFNSAFRTTTSKQNTTQNSIYPKDKNPSPIKHKFQIPEQSVIGQNQIKQPIQKSAQDDIQIYEKPGIPQPHRIRKKREHSSNASSILDENHIDIPAELVTSPNRRKKRRIKSTLENYSNHSMDPKTFREKIDSSDFSLLSLREFQNPMKKLSVELQPDELQLEMVMVSQKKNDSKESELSMIEQMPRSQFTKPEKRNYLQLKEDNQQKKEQQFETINIQQLESAKHRRKKKGKGNSRSLKLHTQG